MQLEFDEYIPRINTSQLYLILWIETFKKIQELRDPFTVYNAVRAFYYSLLPPVKNKINNSYKNNMTLKRFKELEKLIETLETLPRKENGTFYLDKGFFEKLSEEKINLLKKYGFFYQAAGITYYYTNVYGMLLTIALKMFDIITRALYHTKLLTYTSTELSLGNDDEDSLSEDIS